MYYLSTIVILVVINFIACSASSPPIIRHSEKEFVVNIYDHFNVTCSGKENITWSFSEKFDVQNVKIVNQNVTSSKEYPYSSNLYIRNVTCKEVGNWTCREFKITNKTNENINVTTIHLKIKDISQNGSLNSSTKPCSNSAPDINTTVLSETTTKKMEQIANATTKPKDKDGFHGDHEKKMEQIANATTKPKYKDGFHGDPEIIQCSLPVQNITRTQELTSEKNSWGTKALILVLVLTVPLIAYVVYRKIKRRNENQSNHRMQYSLLDY